MTKEEVWMKKRLGRITASELGSVVSASGKIIDGNKAYIRRKRFERIRGFALPISSKYMDYGNSEESMAVAWLREHFGGREILYSKDQEEIPFWTVDWANFGASPDAFSPDETIVYEIKVAASNGMYEFFADPGTTMDEKRAAMEKEYLPQVLGQFLSNPEVQEIDMVRYLPQRDDVMEDVDSPLAEWRGYVFPCKREDYGPQLVALRDRIVMFDALIDSGESLSAKKG